MEQPKGGFCQSCGMPMRKPEDFGTYAEGSKVNDYCCFCFQNGAFTEPDTTMERMIERAVDYMVTNMNTPEPEAKSLANRFFPRLKRWQGD